MEDTRFKGLEKKCGYCRKKAVWENPDPKYAGPVLIKYVCQVCYNPYTMQDWTRVKK
jgi:hypothetical protein